MDHQNRRSVLAAAGFSGLMIFVIFCLGTCIKITHGLTLPVTHNHMCISGVIILRIMHAYMLARLSNSVRADMHFPMMPRANHQRSDIKQNCQECKS